MNQPPSRPPFTAAAALFIGKITANPCLHQSVCQVDSNYTMPRAVCQYFSGFFYCSVRFFQREEILFSDVFIAYLRFCPRTFRRRFRFSAFRGIFPHFPYFSRLIHFPYFLVMAYFSFVAWPPLRWRSALFFSRTAFTSWASILSSSESLTVTSLCIVDFDIPKCFAAARTVESVSTMYSPSLTALSSETVLKSNHHSQ